MFAPSQVNYYITNIYLHRTNNLENILIYVFATQNFHMFVVGSDISRSHRNDNHPPMDH